MKKYEFNGMLRTGFYSISSLMKATKYKTIKRLEKDYTIEANLNPVKKILFFNIKETGMPLDHRHKISKALTGKPWSTKRRKAQNEKVGAR